MFVLNAFDSCRNKSDQQLYNIAQHVVYNTKVSESCILDDITVMC